jgi:hypothetical protein
MDHGAPERIRTSDPQIRSLVLYPRVASEPLVKSRSEVRSMPPRPKYLEKIYGALSSEALEINSGQVIETGRFHRSCPDRYGF